MSLRLRLFSAFSVVVTLLLAAVFAGLQLPSGASAASSVDVTANLTVPNQGNAGETFVATAEISNIGADAADGATFRVEFAPGTQDLAAECESSDGGATCPVSFDITQSTAYALNGVVEGVVPALPVYGKVVLRITGKLTALDTTAKTVLQVAAPAGSVDSDSSSDISEQNTVIYKPNTVVTITSTQDKVVVNSGEARIYTVTYENTGTHDVILDLEQSEYVISNSTYNAAPGGGYVTAGTFFRRSSESLYSWSVSCHAASTVTCPSVFDGHIAQKDSAYLDFYESAHSSAANDYNYYKSLDLYQLLLPVGKKLVLTIKVTQTLKFCVLGGEYLLVQNKVSVQNNLHSPVYIPNTYASSDYGYVKGVRCPETSVVVTKTQDKVNVNSGETRTYTVTYENTGSYDAVVGIKNRIGVANVDFNLPGIGQIFLGSLAVNSKQQVWSVSCSAASTAPCPAVFDGHVANDPLGTAALYEFWDDKHDLYRSEELERVLIPAGKKLILTIPVTTTLNSCIQNSEYISSGFYAEASLASFSPVSFPEVRSNVVMGLIKGTRCSNATVNVSQTQDKAIVDLGETRTYTVTYENPGSQDILVTIQNLHFPGWPVNVNNIPGGSSANVGNIHSMNVRYTYAVSCHNTSTAPCPSTFDGHISEENYDEGSFYRVTDDVYPELYEHPEVGQISLPAGTKLVLNIPVTINSTTGCVSGGEYFGVFTTASVHNATGVSGVAINQNLLSGQIEGLVKGAQCNDVSSTTVVSNTQPDFGSILTVTSRISNAVQVARLLPITQVLPANGILSAQQAQDAGLANTSMPAYSFVCRKGTGTGTGQVIACPNDTSYDAATHTVKTTYAGTLNANEWFEIATTAFAGFVPATTASYDIRTELGNVPGDVNPNANNSSVTVRYRNSQVNVTSEHSLNIPAPVAITLSGVLTCQAQGDHAANPPGKVAEFTAVIPEGATSVTVPVMQGLWKHDTCKVTVTRGNPPAGYYWADADEWLVDSVANRANIDSDWHVVFPMRLAVTPVPIVLPLTGGWVSADLFVVIGSLFLVVAVGYVVWRQRKLT